MLKAQKVEFVKHLKNEIKGYKTVGVMPLGAVPDRLIQKVRNQLKPDTRVIIARRNLVMRALEGDAMLTRLEPYIGGNVALVLSNKDPFELYKIVSSNKLKLAAKPNQIAPADISIDAGETTIAPGQAVTDLKAGGIDVQIQKGKVVIAKGKTLVQKGGKITVGVSKALKLLDIMPFEVAPTVSVFSNSGLLFTEQSLRITQEYSTAELARSFNAAYQISVQAKIVTSYNANVFVRQAYFEAMKLGIDAKVPVPGIIEKLLANIAMGAKGLEGMVKTDAPAPAPVPATEEKKE